MVYERERQIALTAAIRAARLCEQVRQKQNSPTITKADASPVTVADFASQAIICQAISSAFPEDPIIGEEDGSLLKKPEFAPLLRRVSALVQTAIPNATEIDILYWLNQGSGSIAPRYWTLDPIDGTKGYIRGDQYAIALALVEAGRVRLGVLACPALPVGVEGQAPKRGVIFLAIRGQGAAMMSIEGEYPRPIHVNPSGNMAQIRRLESVESAHSDRHLQAALDRALGLRESPIQMDSQAKYGAVARGEADLYVRIPRWQIIRRPENIWDHAAGSIVVEEAGGKVTDLAGKPLDFASGAQMVDNQGILVSNGTIHGPTLRAIKQILG